MIVIFYLSRLLGVALGLAVGVVVAFLASGWAGMVIGVILGFCVGCLAGGLLPEFALIWIRFSFKRQDATRLRARLEKDSCLSHVIIAELVSRGEPVEQFRGYVESLIRSDSAHRRGYGKMNRRKWFPDMTP